MRLPRGCNRPVDQPRQFKVAQATHLEGDDNFASCQSTQHMRHVPISGRSDVAATQVVSIGSVESSGD